MYFMSEILGHCKNSRLCYGRTESYATKLY